MSSRSFLCGQRISGKATLLREIIQNRDKTFLGNPKNTYYCYSVGQESYDKIKSIAQDIKCLVPMSRHKCLGVFSIIKASSRLIIDDIAKSIEEWSQEMLRLFMVRLHHELISVTVFLYNLFHQSKFIGTLASNCAYYIIYRVVRDSNSLKTINTKIYPGEPKCLLSAYDQATNIPYGYILFNLNKNTPE